jgi:hypothetical protein
MHRPPIRAIAFSPKLYFLFTLKRTPAPTYNMLDDKMIVLKHVDQSAGSIRTFARFSSRFIEIATALEHARARSNICSDLYARDGPTSVAEWIGSTKGQGGTPGFWNLMTSRGRRPPDQSGHGR